MVVLLCRYELGWSYFSSYNQQRLWQCCTFLQSWYPHVSCQTLEERQLCFITRIENTRQQLPNLRLGHPLTFFFLSPGPAGVAFRETGQMHQQPIMTDSFLPVHLLDAQVFGSKDRLEWRGNNPVSSCEGSRSLWFYQCYSTVSSLLTDPDTSSGTNNKCSYLYSFLAYSSLHIPNASPCSFTAALLCLPPLPCSSNQIFYFHLCLRKFVQLQLTHWLFCGCLCSVLCSEVSPG